jgi:putative nucleotidyltransferase with HDIG domain
MEPRAGEAALPARRAARHDRVGVISRKATVVAPRPWRLPAVLGATFLVAVLPVMAVWWVHASGLLRSSLLGAALGVALSLALGFLGTQIWQRRPGSRDLLFSELLLWGYVRRRLAERRLASAQRIVAAMGPPRDRNRVVSVRRQARLLRGLAAGMDAREPETVGHSRRVARHAWAIARQMGLDRREAARVRAAAAIHDIGKMETPLSILRKPGALTDAEYEIVKRHPGDGARMAAVLGDDRLVAMIRHHHERLDGTGYPDRLAGEQIPLGARIIAVADTFDAITIARPYRPPRVHRAALEILRREAGAQLDPGAVRAFCAYYTGRRPLALWVAVMNLSDALLSRLGGGLVGTASATGASAARMAALALALVVGGASLGTTPLTRPASSRPASSEAPAARLGRDARGALPAGSRRRTAVPADATGPHARAASSTRRSSGRRAAFGRSGASGAAPGSAGPTTTTTGPVARALTRAGAPSDPPTAGSRSGGAQGLGAPVRRLGEHAGSGSHRAAAGGARDSHGTGASRRSHGAGSEGHANEAPPATGTPAARGVGDSAGANHEAAPPSAPGTGARTERGQGSGASEGARGAASDGAQARASSPAQGAGEGGAGAGGQAGAEASGAPGGGSEAKLLTPRPLPSRLTWPPRVPVASSAERRGRGSLTPVLDDGRGGGAGLQTPVRISRA